MSDAEIKGSEQNSDRGLVGRPGFWIAMVGLVTGLAGLLFGYDQGVISGALHFIQIDFDLSQTMVEVVTSWVTLGALFGALAGGTLADRLGRRKAGMLAGALFSVGALTQGLAPDTAILVVGRFVVGFGVGVASVAAPLYAAEVAPARIRGRIVSLYQLAITMGIFIAYIVDALLASSGNWRLMLSIAAVPGILLVLGMALMPESSRWLVKAGRRDDARSSAEKFVPPDQVESELDRIQDDIDREEIAGWKVVLGRSNRKALWVGMGLAVFQQVTGINAIIYYADQIFDLAGFTSPTAQADATLWAVGGVNVLATLIAVAFVDKVGRRALLLAGLVGMTVSLTAVGLTFAFVDSSTMQRGSSLVGILTLIWLVVYIASFAFSLGPVVWTMINEIFPNNVRGRAVSLATAINWAAAFLVSQFFLTMIDELGTSVTFWLFAVLSVAAFVWIWKKVPETKGLTLEEVQELWKADDPVKASAHLTA